MPNLQNMEPLAKRNISVPISHQNITAKICQHADYCRQFQSR